MQKLQRGFRSGDQRIERNAPGDATRCTLFNAIFGVREIRRHRATIKTLAIIPRQHEDGESCLYPAEFYMTSSDHLRRLAPVIGAAPSWRLAGRLAISAL